MDVRKNLISRDIEALPGLSSWVRHSPANQVRRSRMEELKTEPTLSEAKHMVDSGSSQTGETTHKNLYIMHYAQSE